MNMIVGDQCQYRQESIRGDPVKKPTGWMSNSFEILAKLGLRCQGRVGNCSRPGGGRHAVASGRVAREAAVYPFEVCKAILEGCLQQLQKDGRTSEHLHGIQESWEPEDLLCIDVAEQCQIIENQARLKENFAKIAEMTGLQPDCRAIKTAYAREAATLRMTNKRSLGRPSRSEAQSNLPGFIGALGPKVYRDAMTGQALDEALVRAAQSLELDYFKGKDL